MAKPKSPHPSVMIWKDMLFGDHLGSQEVKLSASGNTGKDVQTSGKT